MYLFKQSANFSLVSLILSKSIRFEFAKVNAKKKNYYQKIKIFDFLKLPGEAIRMAAYKLYSISSNLKF